MSTKIPYVDEVWNPWGCDAPPNHFKVKLHPERLEEPLKWKKPRRILVPSMGDLFHEDVPFEYIKKCWDVASECRRHSFLFLTKRPLIMLGFTQWMAGADHISVAEWPRNCCLGVSVENADNPWRVLELLKIPAAVHFVSFEPLLGPVDLRRILDVPNGSKLNALSGDVFHCIGPDGDGQAMFQDVPDHIGPKLDWAIVGCESGPKRRECQLSWIRDIVQQCRDASVPCFVKQIEVSGKVSTNPDEWPLDLRVREYPK